MLITEITALRPSLAPALQGLCVFYVCVIICVNVVWGALLFRLKQASKHQTSNRKTQHKNQRT